MRFKLLCVLLIVLLIALVSQSSSEMGKWEFSLQEGLTKAEAVVVYNNLGKYTGVPGNMPLLIIADDPQVNAWIDTENMTITTGMLAFVKNQDELAAVIGHEMGHYILQHFELKTGDSRLHEANADKFGIYLMLRAGYDVCNAKGVWERFDDRFGDSVITISHPSPAQRVWEFQFPICSK